MKRTFFILAILILCLSITGCGKNSSINQNQDSKKTAEGENEQADMKNVAVESEKSQNMYDTDLKVFVVDGNYMEFQWTFAEGVLFDATVLDKEQQDDEYNPQITLTVAGGLEKDSTNNVALDYDYFSNQNDNNLSPNLKQLLDNAQLVANSKDTAECEITKEIQGNTLIVRIKASENSSFDFDTFEWYATKIRFGYDETTTVYKEYASSIVMTDYSLNDYPNPEYAVKESENTSNEITFDDQKFSVDSKYYTIYKFEVPKVFVFDDGWFYSESWDTWNFTSRGEKESSITEYQITTYDETGNVINHETRTIFPTQEDLLSSYRGDKGSSEKEKDMTFETAESRLNYFYDYYRASYPDVRVEGNTIYNGAYFIDNVQFDEMYDFSAFIPDETGNVQETVPYHFQVEGGYSADEYQMIVTAFYSDPSIYPNN